MRTLTRHPLARALRVDKLTLAALEATLAGPVPPVAGALAADPASLVKRAERAVARLASAGLDARVVRPRSWGLRDGTAVQVIATAGHVDHGKSALVRVLTGMEPDRCT